MCKQVTCPNDGKPTWWGCGKHVEQALASIPPSDRCDCPHEPASVPGMYEVKKNGPSEGVQLKVGRAGADAEK
ncbi:hypothetical protein J008_02467 [Cryptococcus neoformans]|uniref:Expressed protein n=3 Tax=Cryptococcus neoformans species complex TaxID=1897064 RepID=Q5KG13_CRYD1|nr:hypothetical protein CNAG_06866 [Cryptococcus neoformans var. grubii H99]XP_570693.1 expressed protein [Cryptococcus neoformans var. neoformans JEC21]XP_571173.1 expressed protein [Cryptococcus neoformans var. neoformans JEC21]AUB24296.1 hypothetical protein CKF44_06866 [Cryptococcus neoformans var. grubii]OWT39604.1 hypothetical protein C362_02092 [Cryptococcus neoformans var. grubii Bt1]OWZ32074.1 hypothetical protein C347_02763 [Cryptococcus neoformans var. grubii AD2-60a]OWZ44742.1 hyp|eukprot:XP_012049607.1 hypothetical protein CNAG_06866 [Cryptococcus neoformans var. grubii H99]